MVNLTHRNRFIETRAARFNSAAVPPLRWRGLVLRIRLVKFPKKAAKKSPLRWRGGTAAEDI